MTDTAVKAKRTSFPGDTPTGKRRKFWVQIEVQLELDESVIAQGVGDDGYIRKNPTEDEVLEHLAFNLCLNGLELSRIDGYANCPNESARTNIHESIIEVSEIKEKKPAKRRA